MLRMQIVEGPAEANQPVDTFAVGPIGATVGRTDGCDWKLDDPNSLISRMHFHVTYEEGKFRLRDNSTNGSFLNGSEEAIGRGNQVIIADGDQVQIGEYIISFTLMETPGNAPVDLGPPPDLGFAPGQSSSTGTENPGMDAGMPPAAGDTPQAFADVVATPLGAGLLGSEEPPRAKAPVVSPLLGDAQTPPSSLDVPVSSRHDSADLLPPAPAGGSIIPDDAFDPQDLLNPPPATPAPAASAAKPAAGGAELIPDDWLSLDLDEPAAATPEPAAAPAPGPSLPPGPAEPPAPAPVEPPAATPAATDMPMPEADPEPEPEPAAPPPEAIPDDLGFDLPPVADIPAPAPQSLLDTTSRTDTEVTETDDAAEHDEPPAPDPIPEPVAAEPPPIPPPQRKPPASRGSAPRENLPPGDTNALRAALRPVLGDEADVLAPGDLLGVVESLGEMFSIVTPQVMGALAARTQFKDTLRLRQTLIRASENNPLKISIGDEQALRRLLLNEEPGMLDGVTAMEQALTELAAHQSALLAALKPALRDTLKSLSPAAIEKQSAGGKSDRLPMMNRRGKLWESYCSIHSGLAADDGRGLEQRFLLALATYYEDALASME